MPAMILRTFVFFSTSAALFAILLAACGSDTAPDIVGPDRITGFTSEPGPPVFFREPMEHRAAAVDCNMERPVGAGATGDPMDACSADADCTEGENGRCVADPGKPASCSYDACVSDADCGAGTACACRFLPEHTANTCVHGSCRVDGDCGSLDNGFCSPSGLTLAASCLGGLPVGSIGYYCHTQQDECIDDSDCVSDGSLRCLFSPAAQHWRCHAPTCTD